MFSQHWINYIQKSCSTTYLHLWDFFALHPWLHEDGHDKDHMHCTKDQLHDCPRSGTVLESHSACESFQLLYRLRRADTEPKSPGWHNMTQDVLCTLYVFQTSSWQRTRNMANYGHSMMLCQACWGQVSPVNIEMQRAPPVAEDWTCFASLKVLDR